MKKKILNDLINFYKIDYVEQHLVYSFLQNNNLDFKKSLIISDFLNNFEINPSIYLSVSSFKILQ